MIPEEAVEAAAIRWFATAHAELSWASLPVIEQERLKLCARAALEAAAPHMLADGWARAYAAGFQAAKGGRNYDAIGSNPHRSHA